MQQSVPLGSTTLLVGHLLREIESAICAVLDPGPLAINGEHGHKKKIKRILLALAIAHADDVAETWLRLADKSDEYKLERLAHRDDLAEPRPFTDDFQTFWSQVSQLLDLVLTRFESRYLDLVVRHKLDALINETDPTREHAKSLKKSAPNTVPSYGYFFDLLKNPAWLMPLHREDLFTRPPAPIIHGDKTVSMPPWPQMRYLRRMVAQESQLVVDIAASIPVTDNAYINADILEIGLAVKPQLAARLVDHVKHGVESRFTNTLFRHKLGEFLNHLARDVNNRDAALDLARSMFTPMPETDDSAQGKKVASFSPIRTRLEYYWYDKLLGETVPVLATCCGQPALEVFCDLLELAVRIRLSNPDEDTRDDWSDHWCESVASPSMRHDVRNLLVSAVARTGEALLDNDLISIGEIVTRLEARPWAIFDRLSLHLLSREPDHELATERALRREYFDSTTVRREYFSLLEQTFRSLRPEEQNIILGWIDEGPDLSAYSDNMERFSGRRPSEDDARQFGERCLRDDLHPIRDSLPPQWRDRYERLVEQYGVPQSRPSTVVWATATESPLTVDELHAMSTGDIVAFIQEWRPKPDDFDGPSPDGLAGAFQSAVAKEPGRFVPVLREFDQLKPMYVSALFSGLVEATKTSWQPEWWPTVLAFCNTVTSKLVESPSREKDDATHKYLLRSVVSLVSAGLDSSEAQLPIALREQVWNVLHPLTDYPDPPIGVSQRNGDSNLDPTTHSHNSVRGQALRAVIHYALWIRRDADACALGRCTNFDQRPEVPGVLDKHLNVDHESAPAVRSVYGELFPWLTLLDETWAKSHVDAIFPCDPTLTHLWDAAWQPYIVFSPAFFSVFPILRKQYEHAVRDLDREISYKVAGNADHREQLAQHLMVFCGRGLLRLDDGDRLLDLFFDTAPSEVRYHALAFVGRSLEGDTPLPPEVLDRFQLLWTRRLEVLKDEPERFELRAFGWWFLSDKFDRKWALQQLLQVIELAGWVEPDHEVVLHLATLARDFPNDAVTGLANMFDHLKESWHMSLWEESAMTILRTALDSQVKEASSAATDLIHRFAAHGFHNYGDLLKEQ